MFEVVDANNVAIVYGTNELVVGTISQTMNGFKQGGLCLYADSVNTFLSFLQDNCGNAAQSKRSAAPRGKGEDSEFFTLETYEEAFDTFAYNPEKVVNFEELDKRLVHMNSVGTDIEYDVWGDFLDIDRHLEGVPEVFGRYVMGNPLSTFATLYINLSVSWMVSQEVINQRAARIQRLVDWLEGHSIRTRIIAFTATDIGVYEIQVKAYEASFDITTLAVAVHSDFFRRMLFRAMEYSKTWDSGYGRVQKIPQINRDHMSYDGFTILVDGMSTEKQVNRAFDDAEASLAKAIDNEERTKEVMVW